MAYLFPLTVVLRVAMNGNGNNGRTTAAHSDGRLIPEDGRSIPDGQGTGADPVRTGHQSQMDMVQERCPKRGRLMLHGDGRRAWAKIRSKVVHLRKMMFSVHPKST